MQITSSKTWEPWHPGIEKKSQILNWMPTDTQECFERSLADSKKHAYLESQGWLDPLAITYEINHRGFRSDQFVRDHPCMIALGCSFTVGIGLPQHQVWPWIVARALNLKVYNLAWGGSSADTCFRLANHWIPQLTPRLVCMLSPPASRFELLTAPGPWPPAQVILPNCQTVITDLATDTFVKHWWANDLNAQTNSIKNKLAVQQIAHQNQAEFIVADVDSELSMRPHLHGWARDFMHVGPAGHQVLAKKMLKNIKCQNLQNPH